MTGRFVTSLSKFCSCGEVLPEDFILVTGFVRPSKDGSEWEVTLLETDPPEALKDLTAEQVELAKDRLAQNAQVAEAFYAHGGF